MHLGGIESNNFPGLVGTEESNNLPHFILSPEAIFVCALSPMFTIKLLEYSKQDSCPRQRSIFTQLFTEKESTYFCFCLFLPIQIRVDTSVTFRVIFRKGSFGAVSSFSLRPRKRMINIFTCPRNRTSDPFRNLKT